MDPEILRALRRDGLRKSGISMLLIAPLAAFVGFFFVLPIVTFLALSIANEEVPVGLPETTSALRAWDGGGLPPMEVYDALIADLSADEQAAAIATAARRLNYERSGYRSLILQTSSRLRAADDAGETAPTADQGGPGQADTSAFSIFLAPSSDGAREEEDALPDAPQARLEAIDTRWAEPAYWAAMKRATWQFTPHYLLRSVDLTMDENNTIQRLPENQRIFVNLIWRTFVISVVVTLATIALGFPLAIYIASQPPNRAAFVMFLVLVPLWTSILVRTTAWLVLLQDQGLLNDTLLLLGLTDERLQLVRNRFGVYIAMIHICLPFMVLPIYSSVASLNRGYLKAAASLGAHPVRVFTKVYLPLVFPGIAAGSMLVFILALGFYITPAIVGGPRDQMVSSFIADAVNRDLNWGFAAALSLVLIAMVILTFIILRRFAPAAAAR